MADTFAASGIFLLPQNSEQTLASFKPDGSISIEGYCTLAPDGSISLAPGYQPTEAAKQFWFSLECLSRLAREV